MLYTEYKLVKLWWLQVTISLSLKFTCSSPVMILQKCFTSRMGGNDCPFQGNKVNQQSLEIKQKHYFNCMMELRPLLTAVSIE